MPTKIPDESSPDVELLECIDDALRNGTNMTRANLAFDLLLKRNGCSRRDLPTYVEDLIRMGYTKEEI